MNGNLSILWGYDWDDLKKKIKAMVINEDLSIQLGYDKDDFNQANQS